MSRLTRRAEADGVKVVWYGNWECCLEGEVGYEEADKLAHYEDLEEAGRLTSLPFEWGQFVKLENGSIGTVNAYTVANDGVLAWVSGYKEAWCGEYLLEEIHPLTEEEIKAKLAELKEGE